jgi:hypothetical protein
MIGAMGIQSLLQSRAMTTHCVEKIRKHNIYPNAFEFIQRRRG